MTESRWTAPLFLASAVLAFYAIPLFSPNTSIQGDAADVHYPLQRYVAERWRAGEVQWTPYLYGGYPILSNPKTAAWYPLNWPFFVLGVSPRAIEVEIAAHALIACLGVFLLLRKLLAHEISAFLGALAYGLSGFFTAHASHVGLQGAAAWFPWLLLGYLRASRRASLWNMAAGAAAGAMMILAGSVQGAMYGMIGLALFAAADPLEPVAAGRRRAGAAAGIALGALLAAAIQIVPGLELMRMSLPDAMGAARGGGILEPGALLTLFFPRPPGATAARDLWLYGGLPALPLAVLGAARGRLKWMALALAGPALWYMAGPALGLYSVTARLPLMGEFQYPVRSWFLVALAMAALAAAGLDRLIDSGRARFVPVLLCAAVFADLWLVNSYLNPLAYARQGFHELYERQEQLGREMVAAPQLPESRFEVRRYVQGMGPMLHPLDLKFETTYGYLRLQPRPMREYLEAIAGNPRLRDGLNVSRYVDMARGRVEANGSVLPRAYFPRAVEVVRDERESLAALAGLRPAERSVAQGAVPEIGQDAKAEAILVQVGEQSYTAGYTAAAPSLLKLAVAWYPGWRAESDGRQMEVIRVDHAMMGVVVPPGSGRVHFYFAPGWFTAGAWITCLTIGAVLAAGVWGRIRKQFDRPAGLKRRSRAVGRG